VSSVVLLVFRDISHAPCGVNLVLHKIIFTGLGSVKCIIPKVVRFVIVEIFIPITHIVDLHSEGYTRFPNYFWGIA